MNDSITYQNSETAMSICAREGCSELAAQSNGYFPFCSKSCRDKVYYKKNRKVRMKDLNAIRSEIDQTDKLLEALYRKWGSKSFDMKTLEIEGFIDGAYHKRVLHKQSGKTALLFLYYGLLIDEKNNTAQIFPENDLQSD